jgi:hypothetical protein
VPDPKIYIDIKCEVDDLLLPIALDKFEDFDSVNVRPGAVYVLGRDTMIRSSAKIRNIVEQRLAHIVFSNPAEGATTMQGQFERFNVRDLIDSGQIIVLSGGDLDNRYRYFRFENFFQRLMNFDENIESMNCIDEIFNNTIKPYKFLFLNGRMRPHRKWMLQSLRDAGLLEQGLYTNLHSRNAPVRNLSYMKNGLDLLNEIEPIHYLPEQYEVNLYQTQISKPCDSVDVKHHLFNNEWGEAYIKPEPYIDTYFSIITETVFFGTDSFRTEKIWKPILIGHPWICIANKGFYADLRNMGFQTFDNIIDESFDQITDSQLRIERISAIIKDVCTGDMSKFLDECNSICKYNQQHMLDYLPHVKEFPQQFVEYLRENIQ